MKERRKKSIRRSARPDRRDVSPRALGTRSAGNRLIHGIPVTESCLRVDRTGAAVAAAEEATAGGAHRVPTRGIAREGGSITIRAGIDATRVRGKGSVRERGRNVRQPERKNGRKL